MSYAQPSDIITRYDVRRLGDLVNDDGTRASSTQLLSSPVLQSALDDASGMIDAACQRGQRYSPNDLALLTSATSGTPLWNSFQLLVRLTCDLAYGLLVGRRGYNSTDTGSQSPRYVEAMRLLERLGNGDWVFVTANALAAGVPIPQVLLSQDVSLISSNTRYFGNLNIWPNPPGQNGFD